MKVRIGLGLADFPFSSGKAFWRWVGLCEESGVDSLWQSDRLVGQGPNLECMSVMAALSGATRRLKFGMSVLSLGPREPLVVAKECATIDYLSGGRFLPAFGIGSFNSPDWAAVGRSSERQGGRTNEALEIMARLWSGETVDFDGQHFHYRGASVLPLPVQQPLPLWLGGTSPAAIRRTARYGTGWQGGPQAPEEVGPVVAAIKKAAEEMGRPIDPDHFGVSFFYRFGRDDDPLVEKRRAGYRKAFPERNADKAVVVGGADEILARIGEYVAVGASKFILRPVGDGDEDLYDQTRKLADRVISVAHRPGFAAAEPEPAIRN